jgi:hypothetical protein
VQLSLDPNAPSYVGLGRVYPDGQGPWWLLRSGGRSPIALPRPDSSEKAKDGSKGLKEPEDVA